VPKDRGKHLTDFSKVAKTATKPKKPKNFYIKAQFESPIHQTTFETLKYLVLKLLIWVKK
jgi:hypothetical protein